MILSDLVKMSTRQILRNRRRYKSAILGTSLGIAGLITVMTVGDSVESLLGRNLEILGSATIVKASWQYRTAVRWHSGQYFMKDVQDLKKLRGVLEAAPAVWSYANRITYLRKKTRGRLAGVGEDFFRAMYLPITQGREILPEDARRRRHVCVIGETIKKGLFGAKESPLDKIIVFKGLSFKVVGVLGSAEDPSYRETILIPLSVAKAKIPNMQNILDIYIRAENWDIVKDLHAEVGAVLKGNQPGYAESMKVTYYKDRIKAIKTVAYIFRFFLRSAIVVTLLLGGLGITNVMLAVVKERTTEIGLRKAVGATEYMIVSQFLCESLSVSLVGAVTGIVAGAIAVEVLKGVLNTVAAYHVFLLSVAASFVVGVLLGVVSGVIPARAAGKLDPVDAMRFE